MSYATKSSIGRPAIIMLAFVVGTALGAAVALMLPLNVPALQGFDVAALAAACGATALLATLLLTRPKSDPALEWHGEGEQDEFVLPQHDVESAAIPVAPARRPFSVYDEIGLAVSESEDSVDRLALPQTHSEPAPSFAGSPPLPGNTKPIAAAALHAGGLAGRFGKPEAQAEHAPASPQTAPAPAREAKPAKEDLATMSFLQLTERLADAMAAHPLSPQVNAADEPAATLPIDRLRHFEAATTQAQRRNSFLSDDIRDVLADLDQIRGVA